MAFVTLTNTSPEGPININVDLILAYSANKFGGTAVITAVPDGPDAPFVIDVAEEPSLVTTLIEQVTK